jgi:recombinational DNA repair protein (RecF pathway)
MKTQCANCGRPICCNEIYNYRDENYCEVCINAVKNLEAGGRFYGEKLIKSDTKINTKGDKNE